MEKVMEFEEIKRVRTLYMFFSIIPVAKMETIAKWRLVNPPALIQSCLG